MQPPALLFGASGLGQEKPKLPLPAVTDEMVTHSLIATLLFPAFAAT